MYLDNLARFAQLDSQNMRSYIDGMPDQFDTGWAHGQTLPLPESFSQIDRIVIVGMGTAALAGEMLAALAADTCKIPILVSRSYDLPAYAEGQRSLVIGISHAGDDEEVLSALEVAEARGTQILVITTGGVVAQRAEKEGVTLWAYQFEGPERAGLALIFSLLLALVSRLGLVKDLSEDVAEAVRAMRQRVGIFGAESITPRNPAKRMAGQLIGRIPVIYGAGIMAPVARRWKTQINENGKSWAQWEEMPEINHNAASGIHFPHPVLTKVAIVMLTSPQFDHPRVTMRQELTRELYMQHGIAMDTLKGRGSSRLCQIMTQVQFGDYVSYYVAMSYEVDPTPVLSVDQIKEKLALSH
jgi:glucose/mannose-6-phosphate isomerase